MTMGAQRLKEVDVPLGRHSFFTATASARLGSMPEEGKNPQQHQQSCNFSCQVEVDVKL